MEPVSEASLTDLESSGDCGFHPQEIAPAATLVMGESQPRGDKDTSDAKNTEDQDASNNDTVKGISGTQGIEPVGKSVRQCEVHVDNVDSMDDGGGSSILQGEGEREENRLEEENDQQVTAIDPRKDGPSTRREYSFVLCSGIFMSFNCGFVNGNCLSGFAIPSGRGEVTSNFTGIVSNCALSLGEGDYGRFGFLAFMVLSFVFGSSLSGMLTPDPVPYRIGKSIKTVCESLGSCELGRHICIRASTDIGCAIEFSEDDCFSL